MDIQKILSYGSAAAVVGTGAVVGGGAVVETLQTGLQRDRNYNYNK